MSRARMVRPEFWTDSKLARCSIPSRLLFVGLWTFADDYGNIENDPVQIKMQVYPGDDGVDTQALLSELINVGVIVPYIYANRHYLNIPKFAKHQYIKHKSNPRCPFPPDIQETLPTHDGSISPQLELKELELNKNLPTDTQPVSGYIVVGRKKRRKVPYSDEFQQFWSVYPRLIQKEVAYARWIQTVKEFPAADLILAAKIYAERSVGKEERYILHPSTFLNKGRWKDYCIIQDDGKQEENDGGTGNQNIHRGI